MNNVVEFKLDIREKTIRECTQVADKLLLLIEPFESDRRIKIASELIVDAMASVNRWSRDKDFLSRKRYKRRGGL